MEYVGATRKFNLGSNAKIGSIQANTSFQFCLLRIAQRNGEIVWTSKLEERGPRSTKIFESRATARPFEYKFEQKTNSFGELKELFEHLFAMRKRRNRFLLR